MTQTIEQLAARVRELEEEVQVQKTLHEESHDHHRACIIDAYKQLGIYKGEDDEFRFKWVSLEISNLNKQLAASQLHAEQLREALETLNKVSNIGCGLVEKALALPRDTIVLDAYVAKRLHDMACDKGLLRIQVEQLTRQRDLAVEALEKIAAPMRVDGTYNRCREACEILARETLSAIKESEKT